MFGYIRAVKPELKVKEFETYKAVYCSLCRKLGKNYGLFSRFTLSYDFVFLALLNIALSDCCPEFEKKRCAFNPLKKCSYCKNDFSVDMPSAAAMIMLYYKILDNIADEKGIKKAGFIFLKPMFKRAFKKAVKNYPEIGDIVNEYITQQKITEDEKCGDIDRAANPSAQALSLIFALCSENEKQKRVLERLGYCIGRYIYLLDAACDLEDDIKNNSYNPFRYRDLNQPISDTVEPQLYICINEAAAAFELLDIKRFKSILGNIIYLGLEDTFVKELKK